MFEIMDRAYVGERLMWVSVLRRAVFDYVQYKGSAKKELEWKRANRFLFGDPKESEDGASFEDICAMFGWEPSYIRRIIKSLDRSDMKMLEPSRFKDEFKMDSSMPDAPDGRRWASVDGAIPLLTWLTYSRQYREQLKPKPVAEAPSRQIFGLVQWQVA